MQEHEDDCSDPDSVLGRVRDIRRKWAVQEDEALAYRLQDEEIAQHYNSNRTRNAIVREDAPKAREAQRQEELEALEERLQHLSVLRKQADEDARLAKQIATRDTEKAKKPAITPNTTMVDKARDLFPQQNLLEQVNTEFRLTNSKRMKSPLLGAAADVEPGPSRHCRGYSEQGFVEDQSSNDEDVRKFQEDRDAAIARELQQEMDRLERDKQLAVEAQDRELAKMIHEKEKARLKRAKEKARLKAEALLAERGETPDADPEARAASRNSSSSDRSRSMDIAPPKLPDKLSPIGDQISFRAHPKPLPPQPSIHDAPSSASAHRRTEQSYIPPDPVPPYMPIHGYNRNSPKRNK